MMNKYYIFDVAQLHKWIRDNTHFCKIYRPTSPELQSVGVRKNIGNNVVNIIKGSIITIEPIVPSNYMYEIEEKYYNAIYQKCNECIKYKLSEEHFKDKSSVYNSGIWWSKIEIYRVPQIIFDTIMNNDVKILEDKPR